MAIISNVDNDLIAHTIRRLQVEFDWIITAEQAKAYKPSHKNFRLALKTIEAPSKKILHVAQSIYHDIIPAKALGLAAVWVNRRRGRTGSGATPEAKCKADLEVPDLKTLAEMLERNSRFPDHTNPMQRQP
jgi:2-haloacid dehalogenase